MYHCCIHRFDGSEFNRLISGDVHSIGLDWINHNLYYSQGSTLYAYSISSKTFKMLISMPDEDEIVDIEVDPRDNEM